MKTFTQSRWKKTKMSTQQNLGFYDENDKNDICYSLWPYNDDDKKQITKKKKKLLQQWWNTIVSKFIEKIILETIQNTESLPPSFLF